jgi:hypothetical protein
MTPTSTHTPETKTTKQNENKMKEMIKRIKRTVFSFLLDENAN